MLGRRQSQSLQFEVNGYGGRLIVTPTAIKISHRGVVGTMTHGLSGERQIPISQISAIRLKTVGLLTKGFIQFSYHGGQDGKSGLFETAKDANSVFFTRAQQKDFLKAKALIEQYQAQSNSLAEAGSAFKAAGDPIERLSQLAALKESGAISDKEFDLLKTEVLKQV